MVDYDAFDQDNSSICLVLALVVWSGLCFNVFQLDFLWETLFSPAQREGRVDSAPVVRVECELPQI